MALGLVNNVAALNAQNNLNRTNSALSKSLERLSSGLKVNRGADGPAALVISEKQRAQIAGLRTAIDNTNKAVSLVQTGEGALNEINALLTKARSLALDSANSAVQDADSLAANQAEIDNALNTITQIAKTTQFGSRKLLDGSAALNVSTSVQNIQVAADPGTVAGTYDFTVTTAAVRANQLAQANYSTLAEGDIGPVTDVGTVTGDGVISTTGTYTGITNRTYTITVVNSGDIGTNTVDFDITDSTTGVTKRIRIDAGYTTGDLITDPILQGINLTFDTAAANNSFVAGESYTIDATGTGTLTLNGVDISLHGNNAASLSQTIETINQYSGVTGVTAEIDPSNANRIAFASTTFGTNGNFSITVDAFLEDRLGLTALTAGTANNTSGGANGAAAGVNAAGTISDDGGITNTALLANGNVLSGLGLSITLLDNPASTTFSSVQPGAGSSLTVEDKGLVFQIGANAGQTAQLRFSDVRATALGQGVAGNLFASLADIDISTAAGAQDAIAVIDKAIAEVSGLRGTLGAFQANTLETNANNLRATLENTTSAESVIRDTDFAEEIAIFTRNQTLLQAGATVLGNANQIPVLIAGLLRG